MRALIIAGLTLIAAAAVLLGTPRLAAQEMVTVEIREFAFDPHEVTVAPGTRVRWVNRDDAPHAIAMQDRVPGSSDVIDPGKEHAVIFRQAGRFTYRCGVHPTMLGIVIVQ